MLPSVRHLGPAMCFAVIALAGAGCGGSDDPYKTPPSEQYDGGKKASLPAVPTLPTTPIKSEGNYTVYGASHQLRNSIHNKDVTKDAITVVGYIVQTNIASAPADCQHPQGKEDGPGCKNPDVPSFWIADNKDAGNDPKAPKIRVVHWARNYSVIYDAIDAYGKLKAGEKPDKPVSDAMLGIDLPFPLPAVGAKVKVTGKYNVFGRSGGALMSDPVYGIIEFDKMETVELAPAPAAFASNKKP
jgi:hypothetical protein